MAATERVSGEARLGSRRQKTTLMVDTAPGFASGLVLMDSAGTEYVIWVSTAGFLKIGTRTQHASPNAASPTGGTTIGVQTP